MSEYASSSTVSDILWIVVVVAVLVAIGRHGELFTFYIFVSVFKDIAHTADVFDWLSYPQLWIIFLPVIEEGWAGTEVQLWFTSLRS
jgi:hypothetical protein